MGPGLLIAFAIIFPIFPIDPLTPGPATDAVVAKGPTAGLWRPHAFITGPVVGDLSLLVLAVARLAAPPLPSGRSSHSSSGSGWSTYSTSPAGV
jgi:threonine/homoserine/homoserine lactone efflux protein